MENSSGSVLYLTRRVEFCAAHRLYSETMSDVENTRVYGLCANPHGHGHNYILEVTVRGIPAQETGLVLHFHTVKKMLEELVVRPLDHRHLNVDVSFLAGILPTSENLIRVLWNQLVPHFVSENYQLYKLRLSSSPQNWVDYYGQESAQESANVRL